MIQETYHPAFYECDGLRHINNTRIPEWFERAREPLFDLFTPNRDFDQWQLIVARIEIDFLAPLLYGRPVLLETGIGSIGSSSFRVLQNAIQDEAIAARGTAVLVHYNFSSSSAVPLSSHLRSQLEALQVDN